MHRCVGSNAGNVFFVHKWVSNTASRTSLARAMQWDYKTRIQNQNELLAKLRGMLNTMLQQKQRFKDACIDTETYLRVTHYLVFLLLLKSVPASRVKTRMFAVRSWNL